MAGGHPHFTGNADFDLFQSWFEEMIPRPEPWESVEDPGFRFPGAAGGGGYRGSLPRYGQISGVSMTLM
jgi:hypothetical protein